MASKGLEQIADLRGCSYEDARLYCDEVRGLCKQSPSTTSILEALRQLEQLEEPCPLQKVASLATQLHVEELAARPRRRRARRGQAPLSSRGRPKFIIDEYGTVQSNTPQNRDVFDN